MGDEFGPSPEEMGLSEEDKNPTPEQISINNDSKNTDKEQTNKAAKIERFTKLSKLDIENPEQRVSAIKDLDADRFLDVISVANGLLRGQEKFQRWPGESASVQVSSPALGVDLLPPENSHEFFRQFYEKLQSELDPSNEKLEKSAVEMYFSIIGSHLFEDGNGKLARIAFYLVKYGELPKDMSLVLERSKGVTEVARRVNIGAIGELLKKEGVEYKYINDIVADEEISPNDEFLVDRGRLQQLKYIAARRVMLRNGTWPQTQPDTIGLKEWSEKDLKEFKKEFGQVREEWIRSYISVASEYAPWAAKLIESTDSNRER